MGRLEGKVAVILGAAGEGNMGQVIARRFAREGARCRRGGPAGRAARGAGDGAGRARTRSATSRARPRSSRWPRRRSTPTGASTWPSTAPGWGLMAKLLETTRGADRQADGAAVQGTVLLPAGVRRADGASGRRLDHHHVLRIGVRAALQPRGLHRHQGRARCAGALLRQRVRTEGRASQLDRARADRDADDRARTVAARARGGVSQGIPARPHRHDRGHRERGTLARDGGDAS